MFGWQIRQRGDGATSFDDTVNAVGGAWVIVRPPSSEPGVMIYLIVADAHATVDAVLAAGGVLTADGGGASVSAAIR